MRIRIRNRMRAVLLVLGCKWQCRPMLFSSVVLPNSNSSSSSFLFPRLRLRLRLACSSSRMEGGGEQSQSQSQYKFGPYQIDPREVFYSTSLSYAMVNLRPLLPGHILVCPRREVKRFIDLSSEETSDLWITAQKVGAQLEHFHKASSLTLAIQDGPQAGQTVPHVHIHVIPRKSGDFEKNDEIYDAMDVKEKELKEKLDLDIERKDRTLDQMAHEADTYRALFSS